MSDTSYVTRSQCRRIYRLTDEEIASLRARVGVRDGRATEVFALDAVLELVGRRENLSEPPELPHMH